MELIWYSSYLIRLAETVRIRKNSHQFNSEVLKIIFQGKSHGVLILTRSVAREKIVINSTNRVVFNILISRPNSKACFSL